MMSKAKSDIFRLKIDASKATDPKAGWKFINSLTGRGNKSSPVNDILVNDRIVSDDKDTSESFNDFFVNIGPTLAAGSTKSSSNNVNAYLSNIQNNFPAFRFSNIPVENVALTLKNSKVTESTGFDQIPAKVLKIASSIIAPKWTVIFKSECPRRPREDAKMWHMLEKLISFIFRSEIAHDELINVVYLFCSDLLLFSKTFAKTVQDADHFKYGGH